MVSAFIRSFLILQSSALHDTCVPDDVALSQAGGGAASLLYDVSFGDGPGADGAALPVAGILGSGSTRPLGAHSNVSEAVVSFSSIPGKHRVAGLPRKRPREAATEIMPPAVSLASQSRSITADSASAAVRVPHEPFPEALLAPAAADYQLQNGPGASKAAKPFRAPAGATALVAFSDAAAMLPVVSASATLQNRRGPSSPATPDRPLAPSAGAAIACLALAGTGGADPLMRAPLISPVVAPIASVSSFRAPGIISATPAAASTVALSVAPSRGRALFSGGDGDASDYTEGLSTDEPMPAPLPELDNTTADVAGTSAGDQAHRLPLKGPAVRARPKLSKRGAGGTTGALSGHGGGAPS